MTYATDNSRVFTRHVDEYRDVTYWRDEEEALVSRYFTKRPADLLVGGVGAGRTLPHLYALGFRLTALDISDGMIAACKAKYSGIADIRLGDIQRTDFPSESFDYIFLPFHTMCYVDAVDETLKEMKRLLRPGGVLIFSMVNRYWIRSVISGKVILPLRRKFPVRRGGAPELWTRQAGLFDRFRFRRGFNTCDSFFSSRLTGRATTWKQRVLDAIPFLSKTVYFVCTV